MSDNCIVLMCNEPYLDKARSTIQQLRGKGKYKDDIVLLIGDDLKDKNIFIDNVIVKFFPNMDRSHITELLKSKPISDGREINKVFQWHKFHVFDPYFKRWKKCLYIDAGMHILNPVQRIIDIRCDNKLIAHSDAYPTFEWKLKDQFDSIHFPDLYNQLSFKYDLDVDYFQSTILIYDTNIIESSTKKCLIDLSNRFINSKTNEQAIMNLYFNCYKRLWEPMQIKDDKIYYYDYWERNKLKYFNYIMLKYPQTRRWYNNLFDFIVIRSPLNFKLGLLLKQFINFKL